MNLKEMIENRIEENNVLIKKLEDENDEMKIGMFDYYFTRYAGHRREIKIREEENEFLKELLVEIRIHSNIDDNILLK